MRVTLPKPATLGVQGGIEARRATIFFRRLRGGAIGILNDDKAPNVNTQPEIENWRTQRTARPEVVSAPNTNTHNFTPYKGQKIQDYVAIIDVDSQGPNQGYEVIKLQTVPKELEWDSESTFAVIKPMARNTPFYHYTGGESKLRFDIDWYSTSWDRTEVIRNCRRIESLSKADGYQGNPHRVLLKWGEGDVLFKNIYFQVISASYKLTQFNKANLRDGVIERTHMLPVQAYQTVILARIDESNLTLEQIKSVG